MARKFKISIKGTIIVEATNKDFAEDKAIDILHDALIKSYRDILQWTIEEIESE